MSRYGLPPTVVEAARALLRSPAWRWGHGMAGRTSLGTVRVVHGPMVPDPDLLPDLEDPCTVGQLEALLARACGGEVRWAVGCDARGSWCLLASGAYRRVWRGATRGEVVARALAARWAALERRRLRAQAGGCRKGR